MRKKNYDRQTRIFYTCGVGWQHDIGETDTRIWVSLKELKESGSCWKTCGIVRLEIKPKWIRKQRLGFE